MVKQFQTNGACQTQCQDQYAFAVVQNDHCWCSNYMPADTVSVSECGQVCPGYGPENCGDSDKGLFGYVALSKSPLGTAGASSSAPPTPQSSPQPVSTSSAEASTSVVSTSSFGSFLSTVPVFSPGMTGAWQFPNSSPSSPPRLHSISSMARAGPFIDTLEQDSPSPPSVVTVQETVTASPSVQVSLIHIVRNEPLHDSPEPYGCHCLGDNGEPTEQKLTIIVNRRQAPSLRHPHQP